MSNVRVVGEVRGRRQRAQRAQAYRVHHGRAGSDTLVDEDRRGPRSWVGEGSQFHCSSDRVLHGLEAVRRAEPRTTAFRRLIKPQHTAERQSLTLVLPRLWVPATPARLVEFDMSSTLVMSCTRSNVFGPLGLRRPRRHGTVEPGWRVSIDGVLETLHLASLTTTSDTLARICVLLGPPACGSSGCGFCSFGARRLSEERRHWLSIRQRGLNMERLVAVILYFHVTIYSITSSSW